MFHNRVTLLPNLHALTKLLRKIPNIHEKHDLKFSVKWETPFNYLYNYFYKKYICIDKIALQHNSVEQFNKIQIWETKKLLNWHSEINDDNWIASLNYIIYSDSIKISYLPNFRLNEIDEFQLKCSLIYYLKELAREKNKNKIIVRAECHSEKKYYEIEGFKYVGEDNLNELEYIINV
jgi:hypothetical protein